MQQIIQQSFAFFLPEKYWAILPQEKVLTSICNEIVSTWNKDSAGMEMADFLLFAELRNLSFATLLG